MCSNNTNRRPAGHLWLLLFLFSPLFVLSASAQTDRIDQTRLEQRKAIGEEHQYLAGAGQKVAAYVNPKTGTPYWITDVDSLDFGLGQPIFLASESDAEQAARRFIDAYAALLNVQTDMLRLRRITTDGELWFVSFEQVFEDYGIYGSEVGITVSSDGQLVAAGVNAFPQVALPGSFDLSRDAAVEVAKEHIRRSVPIIDGLTLTPNLRESKEATQLIVPIERKADYTYVLAWSVHLEDFSDQHSISRRLLVDAATGDILIDEDLVSHVHSTGEHPFIGRTAATSSSSEPVDLPLREEETATPSAFPTHSVSGTVLLNYYVTPQNNTSPLIRETNRAFKFARVSIANSSGTWSSQTNADANGNYSISVPSSGTYTITFEMRNTRAEIDTGVSLSKRSKSFTILVNGATQYYYDWNWGDDGDGGVSSYGLNSVYHVQEMYDYVKNTLNYNGMDAIVTPLEILSTDQGYMLGTDITVGGAEAMSSEVIEHEYMHTTIYILNGNSMIRFGNPDPQNDFDEAFAMDEGFADYFTISKSGHSTFGGPSSIPEAPAPPNGNQSVTVRWHGNSWTMDDWNLWGTNEPHRRGQIIGGAVWEIRSDLGAAEADRLVFKALQITPRPQSFLSFRERLFAADAFYNSNANRATIENRFVGKKIGGPVPPSYLNESGNPTTGQVPLSWNDLSALEDGYKVEWRFLEDTAWSTLATLSAGSTSYTDTNVFCRSGSSNDYVYRIEVYDGSLKSYSPSVFYNPCGGGAKTSDLADPTQPERSELVSDEVPTTTELTGAYPNPFNPATTITYTLSTQAPVELTVYDVLGRAVKRLVHKEQTSGRYAVVFDASSLPSGLYVYHLQVGEQIFSDTVLLSK